jgi:heat shock protein 4
MLMENQDWLYEEGEDTTKAVYVAKMEEIRFIAGPIIQRYMDKIEAERQTILKVQEEEAARKRAEQEAKRKAEEEAKKGEEEKKKADAGDTEMKDAPATEGDKTVPAEKGELEEKE